MRINKRLLFICVAIPLIVGGVSALLTKNSMEMFEMMSNMDNISEYLKMYQAMSTPSKENSQSDVLKNFLTPEQQKMYESYKDMLNI